MNVAAPTEKPAPALAGVVVVHKPTGPTSHDVVALVRRLTGVKRVGHGGTLDPFASGVLPVFVGRATRLVEYHLADEKGYRAVVAFGARSTTDDLDGELTAADATAPERAAVEAALDGFRGEIEQVPPNYSAVRVAGRKAYELARRGETPELRPRRVDIRALRLVDWDRGDGERPTATLELRCSAGTYVRALARDLGDRLGCGAYLVALQRTASGPFTLDASHSLEALRTALTEDRPGDVLLPPDVGLDEYPRFELRDDELTALLRGQVVKPAMSGGLRAGPDRRIRIVDPSGNLAAMARWEGGRLHPEKVLAGA